MSKVERADLDLVAFVEPAVGREIAHPGHAEAGAARHHIVQQELVRDMRALDRYTQHLAQFGGAADMVDMAMGQPDLLDVTPVLAMASRMVGTSPPGSITTAFLLPRTR